MKADPLILTAAKKPHTGKPQRLFRKALGVLSPALLVGICWRFLPMNANQALSSPQSGSRHNAQAVTVVLRSAAPTVIPQWIEVTGVVQAELDAPIAGKVMGRVQNILVKAGDRVHRNQPLVTLDAQDLEATVAQANANLRASHISYANARVVARMESALSAARIEEAHASVAQSEAALQAAKSKLDLVQAGPRRQEREQATLAVAQARSNLALAESNLRRMAALYEEGAISAQQNEQYRTQYEVAKAQYQTAQQSRSIAEEGSRAEDVQEAQQAVSQAQASVQEARARLNSAQASALQAKVRQQEIQSAQAQIGQSQASLRLAQITRSYATINAPFDGIVTLRLADPGVMASPNVPLLQIQGGVLRLEAVVPESALSSIHKGAPVPVHFDALRDGAFTGRVIEIAPQGDTSSHTFVVKINLPSACGVSAGMFGRARFAIGTETRLLVPRPALFEREGLDYLYVVDPAHVAHLRMVTTGGRTGESVVILSGLNPGERIVITGQEHLTEGTPISEGLR